MKKHFKVYRSLGRFPKIRILLLVLGFILGSQLVRAAHDTYLQQESKVVTGTITDGSTGEALPGVSVQIKGTTKGSLTDIDGKFSLEVTASDVLTISYMGYVTEEIPVGGQTEINVKMVVDLVGIDEVVVVGYGVQKKKLVTGATVQVKDDDIVKSNATRLESSLQGLTPGMAIVKQSGQPGSDYNITIRGMGSVNGSSPLVLIDGVPGSMSNVNPSDVQSIDILKDAASAAIYGSRASDGVILITTKKGGSGKMQVSYDAYYGIGNVPKKVDVLNAQEYVEIMNEQYFNMNPTGTALPYSQNVVDSINNMSGTGTDWQEEAYHKNAPIQSHYFGVTGGNDVSTFSASLSYTKEDGIFDYNNKSQYERMGFRINSEHQVKKYLKIGENLTYTHRYKKGLGVGSIYNNFMRSLLAASPLIELYDPTTTTGFGKSKFNEKQENPIAVMNYYYNDQNRNDDIIGDIYGELEIVKGLKVRTDFGGALNYANNSSVTDTFTITSDLINPVPDYKQYMERKFGYNWDNFISYERSIGSHNFIAMVGTNSQDNWYFNMEEDINAFLVNSNLAPVPSNIALRDDVQGDTVKIKGDRGRGDSRFSIFGRLSYNYGEKYMATLSLRRDQSSRFGSQNRTGYFPSVSAGWVISKESFLQNAAWLDFLKIRASWGQNGKEPNQAGRFLATVGSDSRSYSYGNGRVSGMSPNIMANPKLRWEASKQLDIGFDSRFLKNFNLAFDWYKKTSKDWILPMPTAGISGIAGISSTNPYANGGNVVNTGVEVDLGYVKNFSDLMINVHGNFAYNKNNVTKVPDGLIHGSTAVLYNGSDEFYRVQEDYPIGYFWGYETDGLFQTQEEITNYVNEDGDLLQKSAKPGDVKRIDANGDGVIDDEDKTMIGNPNPDVVYGFNFGASYKGFDISMNFQGAIGNQVVKCYRAQERPFFNYTSDVLDRWQWDDKNGDGVLQEGEGTSNTMPRVTGGTDPNKNWRLFSDLYVEDASYLKLKSINVGYDFKSLWKEGPFEQFRIYFSATNLLTITKYSGLDPEVGYGSYYNSSGVLTDAYASGIDLGFYPTARTYLVGLNVKF